MRTLFSNLSRLGCATWSVGALRFGGRFTEGHKTCIFAALEMQVLDTGFHKTTGRCVMLVYRREGQSLEPLTTSARLVVRSVFGYASESRQGSGVSLSSDVCKTQQQSVSSSRLFLTEKLPRLLPSFRSMWCQAQTSTLMEQAATTG